MKNIKDYLHLYIGCKVSYTGMANNRTLTVKWLGGLLEANGWQNIKPILRPLSDMTEEEFKAAGLVTHPKHWKEHIANYSFQIRTITYLLSRGFDIFGLIEENLAINKTTIT